MAPKINSARAIMLIEQAVGEHKNFREAQIAGIHVTKIRDEVIMICLPYASPIVGKLMKLPGASRVERDDLESAAMQGIVEAVDSFEYRREYNGKRIQITTHLYWSIFRRVLEEREQSHWAIMKPSQGLARAYMAGELEGEDMDEYINTFVRPMLSEEWDEDTIHGYRRRGDCL